MGSNPEEMALSLSLLGVQVIRARVTRVLQTGLEWKRYLEAANCSFLQNGLHLRVTNFITAEP